MSSICIVEDAGFKPAIRLSIRMPTQQVGGFGHSPNPPFLAIIFSQTLLPITNQFY